MKTSLLLMGLVMGVAMVGTAQAASVTASAPSPNVSRQTLAATSVSGDGVLATLSGLLSGKAQNQKAGSAPPCGHGAAHANDKAPPCAPEGARQAAPRGPHHRHAASGVDAPRASSGSRTPSPASSVEPTLGWQSLLPGSIQ